MCIRDRFILDTVCKQLHFIDRPSTLVIEFQLGDRGAWVLRLCNLLGFFHANVVSFTNRSAADKVALRLFCQQKKRQIVHKMCIRDSVCTLGENVNFKPETLFVGRRI